VYSTTYLSYLSWDAAISVEDRLLLTRKVLGEVASIVTPDTILAWHRKLIAQKRDYGKRHGSGRPRVEDEIARLTVRVAQEVAFLH
jgi:hypothetical protein